MVTYTFYCDSRKTLIIIREVVFKIIDTIPSSSITLCVDSLVSADHLNNMNIKLGIRLLAFIVNLKPRKVFGLVFAGKC